jgi:hypothetical protein
MGFKPGFGGERPATRYLSHDRALFMLMMTGLKIPQWGGRSSLLRIHDDTETHSHTFFIFFFSFGVIQLMLLEAPQLYGLLYYPPYLTFQLSPSVPSCHAP